MSRAAIIALLPGIAGLLDAQPVFYRDVLPILQRHCQNCHREGEIAPMPLSTYAQVRPWAKSIKTAVLTRQMPPWFADPHYGKFRNDTSLTQGEISTLVSWVNGGARAGKPVPSKDAPDVAGGWGIPQPDAVIEMPREVHIPPTGTIDYRYYPVATGFTEDRWVQGIEVRPGDRSVVHHAIVYVLGPEGWNGAQYLGGYAPGSVPQLWAPGQARLIRAGSTIVFQMHYTTNGKPAVDRSKLGLIFAKDPPKERIVALTATSGVLEIPPGIGDYKVDARRVLPEEVSLVGMRAHMHLRGKSFEFRAVYPDGHTEVLLRIPKYDFNWQPYYYLETPLKLPRGARIECTAVYDNSANNPFNPNPAATVHWGPQSWDEMMIGWLDVAVPANLDLGRTPIASLIRVE